MDIASVGKFIDSLELPEPLSLAGVGDLAVGADQRQRFDEEKDQATVVAATLLTFPKDTPVRIRDAVSNWTLLAQLAATKAVPDRENNMPDWLAAYRSTLERTGWSIVEYSGTTNVEDVDGFTVHHKILDVVAAALAPVPAALAIVTAALNGLRSMDRDSPFIKLFDRRSKSVTSAGFAVANCESDSGAAALRGLEFEVSARQSMTQVLFFKFTSSDARLTRSTFYYRISAEALERLSGAVADKVLAHAEQEILATEI